METNKHEKTFLLAKTYERGLGECGIVKRGIVKRGLVQVSKILKINTINTINTKLAGGYSIDI